MSVVTSSIDMADAIRRGSAGGHLSEREMETIAGLILDGMVTQAQVAALLVSLARSGETSDELAGAARAMYHRAIPVQNTHDPLLDVCGTGGDLSGSFNISTATALVVAGAGVPVAKHGNRAMSSRCGSADVLEALGVPVHLTSAAAAAQLEAGGITFLYAQDFHPALRRVSSVRREIGIRTLFNLIGPLCNPAQPTHQIVGVPERRLLPVLAGVLARLGRKRVAVVCSEDGMDELSVSARSHVVEWNGAQFVTYEIQPEMIGVRRHPRDAVQGGNTLDNASIIRRVLDGVRGPHRDIVVLNAALALQIAGAAPDLERGAELASSSIDDGGARRALTALGGGAF